MIMIMMIVINLAVDVVVVVVVVAVVVVSVKERKLHVVDDVVVVVVSVDDFVNAAFLNQERTNLINNFLCVVEHCVPLILNFWEVEVVTVSKKDQHCKVSVLDVK